MKLILVFIFSSIGWAQDICAPNVPLNECQNKLRDAIFFDRLEVIKPVLKNHGIKIFFQNNEEDHHNNIVRSAAFFNKVEFFKLLTSHTSYPQDIPSREEFLKDLFPSSMTDRTDPGLCRIIFLHQDKNKRFSWWDNQSWPYPQFKEMKEKYLSQKNKSKDQDVFTYFDQIDALKKDVCTIKSVSDLEKTIGQFKGIEELFKKEGFNLLSCAVKDHNYDLSHYLLSHNIFHPESLPELLLTVQAGKQDTKNLGLIDLFSTKMKEFHIKSKDVRTNQALWLFENRHTEASCYWQNQGGLNTEFADLDQFIHKVVWAELLKEVEGYHQASKKSDGRQKSVHTDHMIELIEGTGFSINAQDEHGKTLLHHLAPTLDKTTLEKLESRLNISSSQSFHYKIQDNEGNTALHLALLNQNLEGALNLADGWCMVKNGFATSGDIGTTLLNDKGESAYDILKKIKVNHKDKTQLLYFKKLKYILQGKELPYKYQD